MDEKAIELVLKKLEELGSNYGSAFTDAAINYAHMKAFENTLVPLIVCVLSAYLVTKIGPYCKSMEFDSFWQEVGAPFITGCLCFLSAIMFLVSLNPAAWYGLFEPKVYLTYRLFEKVL